MKRKTTRLVYVFILAAIFIAGCMPDLIPVGRPDLTGPPGFCKIDKQGYLTVTVKNQGSANALASTTTIEFSAGGSFDLPTPAIPAGKSVNLQPLKIPAECYHPDCSFKITVDSKNQIKESNEANNTAGGSCIG
ncbi:MAG TPA: CARDB domain-containing protein [Terriglobales bacterium]|nr:CARDB domain-containing protein [Terriglobales bacterium]